MNVLQHTPKRLTLQQRPWMGWVLGLLFMVGGGYLALVAGEAVFGSVFAAAGLGVMLIFGETVTCTFDLGTGQFTGESKGPLGTKRVQHSLKDIVGVRVVRGGGRHQTFRVVLVRRSGKLLPLTAAYSSGKQNKEKTAECIRTFLSLTNSDPREIPIPGFRQLLKMALNPAAQVEASTRYDPVVDGYEDEIRRNPQNVEAYRSLAMALAFQNKPREARAKLENARSVLVQQGNHEVAAQFDTMLQQLDRAVSRSQRAS